MIDEHCMAIRQALEDSSARTSEESAHLAGCAPCRAHAELLSTLRALEPAEADEARVSAIMAALPPARWQQRRALTWMPLAAGLALVAGGGALVGSLPAGHAVGALPGVLSGLLSWGAAWTLDAVALVRGGSDAVRALLAAEGASLLVWLGLTAAGGGLAVRALVRGRSRGEGE